MREYLLDLYEIQKIDLGIREHEKHQEAVPTKLRELQTQVEQLTQQITTLETQRDNYLQEWTSLRQSIEEENQKLRKWDARLNDIRNQREYQALSRETESAKRANKQADEKLNELSKAQEAVEEQIAKVQETLAQTQLAYDEENNQVETTLAALQSKLLVEKNRRDALIPKVPKNIFHRYDAIRNRRLGVGLSPVVGGCCTGCHIKLPPQLYNTLQRGNSIEQCPNCHRLIFWDQILPESESKASATPEEEPPVYCGV